MIIFENRRQAAGPTGIRRDTVQWVAVTALGMGLLSGCASPGPARAPSLKLPEIATGLAASRVGDEVRLHWTTPARTTDKQMIAGPIKAEICRVAVSAAATSAGRRSGASAAAGSAATARRDAELRPCSPVALREPVAPGESEAVDRLPTELATGPARLLAYRVQLRNAAGRTAGATAAVYAAAGAAPAAVEGLRARAAKAGVVLEWQRAAGDAVELNRTAVAAGAGKKSAETRLRVDAEKSAGGTDSGGTVDRTAQVGQAYRYSAQRVRAVELGGQRVELRSAASPEIAVERTNVFPPEAPVGLVAVPGFTAEVAPAIDLSWEPDLEPHVAGYRVYRREWDGAAASVWRRLDADLVPVAAYRDLAVAAGHRYAYRVTAVDAAGNESVPSGDVVETAPAQ